VTDADFDGYGDENRRIWEANACWWDDRIGDGNDFQDVLIEPATERLLDLSSGDLVLDIACGAGRFTRRMATLGARKVSSYLKPFTRKTEGIIGQPRPQYYFHRPLQMLLDLGFRAGLVIDGLEEPGLGKEPPPRAGLSWDHMPDIPPILVARMRKRD